MHQAFRFVVVFVDISFFFLPLQLLLVNNVYGVTCFELFSWKSVSFTAWFEWNQWSSVKIAILKDVFSDTFFLFFDWWIPSNRKKTRIRRETLFNETFVGNLCNSSIVAFLFLPPVVGCVEFFFSVVVSIKFGNFVCFQFMFVFSALLILIILTKDFSKSESRYRNILKQFIVETEKHRSAQTWRT